MTALTGIFLDTGVVDDVMKYHAMHVIRGVTTNPTILVRDGVAGGWLAIEKRCKELAALIDPLPLSVEVTKNDADDMIEQARMFGRWAPNINVKIPIHGPEGGTDNLRVVHELESRYDVRVNVTAMMSAQQGFLAAMAGATYVSIFAGRVNDMGHDASQELRRLRELLERSHSGAQIIAGSTRETRNILDWFEAGAHIVTVVPRLLDGMLVHPYSKETVRQFLKDGELLQRG